MANAPKRTLETAGLNPEYVESLYLQYQTDPSLIDASWRYFFEGFDLAQSYATPADCEQAHSQSKVNELVTAYRSLGHLIAKTNPIGINLAHHKLLDFNSFGFKVQDYHRDFETNGIVSMPVGKLEEIVIHLQDTYCRSLGVEYMHIQDTEIRRWMQEKLEPVRSKPTVSTEKKRDILARLVDAEVFETFIHTHYPGQKRFSLEGAETMIPMLHILAESAAKENAKEIIIGMPHRGRLNVISNISGKTYAEIFTEFEDNFDPESIAGDGDVKYHKGYRTKRKTANGDIIIDLTSNPSHLEAVNPVVEGRARARQRLLDDKSQRKAVVPVLLHGDAAFAGQGLVGETLNLSQLCGYRTGGTIHLVVNNQIGFTTPPEDARSSLYASDAAKMIEAPVLHVNGEDPEAAVFAMELAYEFRQTFHRDIVIDMLCYRKYGHNEGDDPAYTQPALYARIKHRPSPGKLYTKQLIEEGVLSEEDEERIAEEVKTRLKAAFDEVKEGKSVLKDAVLEEEWEGLNEPFSHDAAKTKVPNEMILSVARAMTTIPEGFSLNRKIARKLPALYESIEAGENLDWATAELLAYGSLVAEGVHVRLSGQDSQRGTFSHRHAVWKDTLEANPPYTPLNHISDEQADFSVYNSLLSEAGVLGFEYGYSLSMPLALVIWEAQFGDFVNGAQVIIDQFITSSQTKWGRTSGLVMLLPHGSEGMGPEHSNAYLERYLLAAAENNIQVANLTTPAQFFHAMRRQVKRDFRRPLIVMSPKSLFRHKACVSPVEALTKGNFMETIDDESAQKTAKRLIFCSGKVYYDLEESRKQNELKDVAIVRIEQLYPFPDKQIENIVGKYSKVKDVLWVQEETKNRGAFGYVLPKLQAFYPNLAIRYVGRKRSASPAVGSLKLHRAEQANIVQQALYG